MRNAHYRYPGWLAGRFAAEEPFFGKGSAEGGAVFGLGGEGFAGAGVEVAECVGEFAHGFCFAEGGISGGWWFR